jgi:hypothetical protein
MYLYRETLFESLIIQKNFIGISAQKTYSHQNIINIYIIILSNTLSFTINWAAIINHWFYLIKDFAVLELGRVGGRRCLHSSFLCDKNGAPRH